MYGLVFHQLITLKKSIYEVMYIFKYIINCYLYV